MSRRTLLAAAALATALALGAVVATLPTPAVAQSQGTITPNRRDLSDPRSSAPRPRDPKAPLLNDRRSTR